MKWVKASLFWSPKDVSSREFLRFNTAKEEKAIPLSRRFGANYSYF